MALKLFRLIADYDDRFKTPRSVFEHPFLIEVDFKTFRTNQGPRPPLVPKLASLTDTSYLDDFDNPDDMSLYKEVNERQNQLDAVVADDSLDTDTSMLELKSAFLGFTFKHEKAKNVNILPSLISTII